MINESSSPLALRTTRIQPSATISIATKARELKAAGKNIISLSIGEPDFDTPKHIKEAAIKAINEGQTKYTAVDGIPELKQAIITKFKHDNELDYEPNQILVSCGAKHSLYNLMAALLNKGDEVIIPAPYWVSYPDMVKLCDGTPVIVNTNHEERFLLTPDKLEAAITEKTKLLILNSPSNPTGMCYSYDGLKAIGDVLAKHPDILVVTDDIYEQNIYSSQPFCNILNASPALTDRTIVINGVSKAYAMTGWRIGYAAGPQNIIAAMKKIQGQSTSNPTSVSQYAAVAALTGNQDCVKEMTLAYKERHDYAFKALEQMQGVSVDRSDGTFYTFPLVKDLLTGKQGVSDDIQLCDYLLNEAELALVPGTAFGAPGHVRISFATSMKQIQDAMVRLKAAFDKLL